MLYLHLKNSTTFRCLFYLLYIYIYIKGERTSKKNLVLNESKYDKGDLCEI